MLSGQFSIHIAECKIGCVASFYYFRYYRRDIFACSYLIVIVIFFHIRITFAIISRKGYVNAFLYTFYEIVRYVVVPTAMFIR